jgi:diadenosine tetraphosphate (Ap4A) HIT family hydrolase
MKQTEGQPLSPASCPFCDRLEDGAFAETSEQTVAFPDAFPVTPGHHLLVPRRHVADFFQLTAEEQADLWLLLARLRDRLFREYSPDGINVGMNVGEAAGQTVAHAHVHVIPRYGGDVADPRGGVRWVVPEKAAYWEGRKG